MATPEKSKATVPFDDLVIFLDHLSPADGSRAGTKALNLGRMRQAGLPVPWGFCVTTAAFHEWLAGLEGQREAIAALDRAASETGKDLAASATALRAALGQVPVPAQIRQAVLLACETCRGVRSWAVRSSASAEDLANGSFAGQHESFLSIEGPGAVIESVRRCWVSLFTDRAVLYRAKRHLDGSTAAMAVVVQEMVEAEAAGVLFSDDPVRPDGNRIIIEGARGFGDAVVSGRVTPERVVLDRASLRVVERSFPDGLAATSPVPTLTPSLSRPTGEGARLLDDAFARGLAALAFQAERLLGRPLDLEWAARDGTLHLLQARPITTPVRAASGPPEVWCNANVCENLPGVLTPMSWSLVRLLLAGSFRPILRLIGIDTDVRPWFGLIAGRVYLNAGLSDAILRRVHLTSQVSVWDLLGGRPTAADAAALEAIRRQAPPLPWRDTPALLVLALRSIPASRERSGAAFLRTLGQRIDALAETPFSSLSDAELSAFIPGIVPRLLPELEHPVALARVFACLGPGLACALVLWSACRRWLQDAHGRIAQRLLGGAGDMASATAALDLWRLARWARGRDAVVRVLETTGPFVEVRAQLQTSPEGAAFLDRWNEFLRRHGHHARGELDPFNPRWSDTPDELLDLVRHYLRLPEGFNPLEDLPRRRVERDALFEDCRRRLRNPLKRWLLGHLVRRARRGLAFRENVKSEAVRSLAVLRAALLEAGRRLASNGLLAGGEDVFFLEFEELQKALSAQPPDAMAGTVVARKAERARLEALEVPSIVVGDFAPRDQAGAVGSSTDGELRGLGVSPGVVMGRARVIRGDETGVRVLPGEILVAPCTDPGWTPLFLTAAGIVADIGGQLSHGSIIAREYGIPAVVNVGPATQIIQTGQMIEVDGDRGTVRVVSA